MVQKSEGSPDATNIYNESVVYLNRLVRAGLQAALERKTNANFSR